jgi:hypothetical protein
MHHEEETNWIELLGKGSKARNSYLKPVHFNKGHEYYERPKKGASTINATYTPTLADMLQTASRKTQAIYKISSFGKSQKKIAAHLSYISRRGQLELEDQNGNKFSSLKEQQTALDLWSEDFSGNPRSRNTMHLVLSTPPGTNRDNALKAAKEFLEVEYKDGGHEYLFVVHNDTDHPHVHAVVKMVSSYGNKLNPRKAYLNRVRQEYAKICRSHGIQLEASPRAERGLSGPSTRSQFVQMRRRVRQPQADINQIDKVKNEQQLGNKSWHLSEEKVLRRNQIIRKRYIDNARKLMQGASLIFDHIEQVNNIAAARKLYRHSMTLSVEHSRAKAITKRLIGNISKHKDIADLQINDDI